MFIFAIIEFSQRLSSIFASIKLVLYSAWFFLFPKRKILISFNAEENIWPFERPEHYLEWEIEGILKSFTIKCDNKIVTRIFGWT